MTLRQSREDFATAGHALEGGLSLERRPGAVSGDYLTAFAPGPRALGDASEGPAARAWRVRVDGGTVRLARAPAAGSAWEAESVLFTYTGAPIEEVDVGFDQNANVLVSAQRATGAGGTPEVWLYWFNPLPDRRAYVFESLGAGRTPRLLLDTPEDPQESDLLLFYVNAGGVLALRQQRDRYAAELLTPLSGGAGIFLEDVAKLRDGRVRAVCSVRNAEGTWSLRAVESTLYPHLLRESVTAGGTLSGTGTLRTSLFLVGINETFSLGGRLVDGSLREPLIIFNLPFRDDRFTATGTLLAEGALRETVLRVSLPYDNEAVTAGGTLLTGGASLVQVVVLYTMYHAETHTLNGTLTPSGSLTDA